MPEVLTRLLDQLADGYELQDNDFSAFSDLDRASVAEVRGRWADLSVASRALLLERAGELADVNLELDFNALGRVGLDDPDPEVRERAVTTLWECQDPAVAQRLADLATHDPGSGVRAAAALGLGPFVESMVMDRLPAAAAAAVTEALRVAVEDPVVGVRASALESAGGVPQGWVTERITEAYESEERELRVAALRAMGASGLDHWAEYIADQLYSGEPEMRLEAALAAGQLASEELVEPLGEALADEDPEVVLAVIEALGEIGGDEAIELLTEFAPVVPEGLEDALEEALSLARDGVGVRRFGELDADDEAGEDDDE